MRSFSLIVIELNLLTVPYCIEQLRCLITFIQLPPTRAKTYRFKHAMHAYKHILNAHGVWKAVNQMPILKDADLLSK